MPVMRVTEVSRLLGYLFKHYAGLKKTKVRQILKFGSVCVNGVVVTSHAHPLKPGDTISLLSKRGAVVERVKAELNFRVVYEDADLITVEKPAGLLTVSTELEKEKTLYFELTEYQRLKSRDGRGRVFIVHRLDRDVSGLVIFAKNEAVKNALQKNWHQAVKKYYAVTEGTPHPAKGTIQSNLTEDRFRRVYSTHKSTGDSKLSITHYEVIEVSAHYALLDISLGTGRKNQIRVHLSDLGHPVAGDGKYGAQTALIQRLALHAYHLDVIHPVTGKRIHFDSKIPSSFRRLLEHTGRN